MQMALSHATSSQRQGCILPWLVSFILSNQPLATFGAGRLVFALEMAENLSTPGAERIWLSNPNQEVS
jgi:hypothetical protein